MPSDMAKRIWLDDDTEAALSRLRCNAWRYNAATKKYDRVDEDVAMVEAALQSLLQVQLAYDEAAKRDRVQLAKQGIKIIDLTSLADACRRWRKGIQANSRRWTATGSRRIQKAGKEIYDALDRLEG